MWRHCACRCESPPGEIYYGEFLDQDPFDETKKTHNEVILLKVKDREFLLEFHPTDSNDPSQNLYELISSNKHFSLDENLTSLNNLTYYFQTRGQEEHRIQLDLMLYRALEKFYSIQEEFLSYLRLRFKLTEKDLETSAKAFLKTLLQTLIVNEATG